MRYFKEIQCRLLTLSVALTASLLLSSCNKEEPRTSVEIASISASEFSCEGGLATIEVLAGVGPVSAVTSDADWIELSCVRENVLLRILPNTQPESRRGQVVISAGTLKPATVEITQEAYRLLSVSSSNLDFSADVKQIEIEIRSSCPWTAVFTENPGNCFSWTATDRGICVSSSLDPGRKPIAGRLKIIPEDSSLPAQTLGLYLREKTVYDFLVGSWTVVANDESDRSNFVFSKKKDQYSFNVSIENSKTAGLCFEALMSEGKLRIYSGQECGYNENEGKYLSLHYNGPKNGNGWYILKSANMVAWDAVPVFDEEAGTITLAFKDSGIHAEYRAELLALWLCPDSYFNFSGSGASMVVSYRNLVLSKEMNE